MHFVFVSQGEVEQCCHDIDIGLPGPKGEQGSPGKFYNYRITFTQRELFVDIIIIYY